MDQLTHSIRRANWQNIIRQCQERPSNVTVKQWLAENDVNEKSYYYWLRKFRREACTRMQVPETAPPAEVSFAEVTIPVPCTPDQTSGVHQDPVAVIRCGNLSIELSNDISEAMLSRLLQEVAHAGRCC